MRRTLLVILLTLPALAQQPEPRPTGLPVTRVSLYKNGVGFFEHTGHVTGNAAVTIDFTTAQLNDVLQSLTVIDLNGGRISGAGYNSTTPLDQQLKSLPLALGPDPTAADFYAAIRGARISVNAAGATITGRLLSIEIRSVPEKSDTGKPSQPPIDHYFLTVISDTGEVRTLELTSTSSVHLLEADLDRDVTRYLQLLAGNRSQGLRHLTLSDLGTGSRELHVSYISEVPIWKSTYRILFTDTAKTATIQGWSVVDNTTGIDWTNVQLSLIAGSPQSFIQPLSGPIYSRRPQIPIAQEAQLTPQTFDSSITEDKVESLPLNGRNNLAVHGAMGSGMAGGSGSGPARISMGSGTAMNRSLAKPEALAPPPMNYEEQAEASLTPTTKTAAFDDFFAYNITDPITIRKNESALVPILQAKITADPVTLVSSNGYQTQQPLRALWITNTTNLTLDRGSFSLVENGAFGGEGLLDPIHPAEKRLLSYAADQAVHVTTEAQSNSNRVDHITAAKGVLVLHRAETRDITYVLHNSAATPRAIVLEHPVQPNYTLTSDPKPDETTPTVYRFRLTAGPAQTVRLHVATRHRGVTQYQLTTSDETPLALIVRESSDDPKIKAALGPILDARRRVADAQTAVDQTNTRLTNLRNDEDRQRANITALQNADKSSRDRFVHDLNTTEDAITAAQSELTTRTTALDTAKSTLANLIQTLQIDETL